MFKISFNKPHSITIRHRYNCMVGVECDGECLLEDIKDYLIEIGEIEEYVVRVKTTIKS